VFAITGHGQAHAKLWSDVGVERVFEKPLQLPELLASMRAVLMPVVRVVDPDIADLVPEYLEDRRADLVTMQEALRCQDADTLRRIGHQVRGSGTSYGYPDLTELGQAIESAAKEADWGTLPDLLVQMTEILTP
jgi:HPt (histidine-containing phosphotransfer) domain-containing protein